MGVSFDHVALLQVVVDQMLVQVGAVDVVGGDLLCGQILFIDLTIFVCLVALFVGLTFPIDSRSYAPSGRSRSD